MENSSSVKTKVKELYSQKGIWDIEDGIEYDCYRKEILEVKKMADVVNRGSLLEIGAGRGRVLSNFIDKYRIIVAIDITEAMLNILKSKYRRDGINNVYLVQGDAENLPFKDNMFDLALAPEVVGHCSSIDSLAFEMRRVMKKSGVGIISTGTNYFSIPGFVAQIRSFYNCFLKKGFSNFISDIKLYAASSRKFWIYKQGYARDSYFTIKKPLTKLGLRLEKTSGAGLMPTYLSIRLKPIERLSSLFPFKYLSRVIIISFRSL